MTSKQDSLSKGTFKTAHAKSISDTQLFFPPIFIIGSPRSGTTLLYQLLLHSYRFGYLSNLYSRLHKHPLLSALITKLLLMATSASPSFLSYYGTTSGLLGPHEAGRFWYRWFPSGDKVYVGPEDVSLRTLVQLRNTVRYLCRIFLKPMLFKNTYNSLRIAPLSMAFPEALFIATMRNPVDTCQSILTARVKTNNSKNAWWGLKPKEYFDICDLPYWQQIPAQIHFIIKQIESDLKTFAPDRHIFLDYEEICRSPASACNKVSLFLKEYGIVPDARFQIPESFPFSSGKRINDHDYALLKNTCDWIWRTKHDQ